jgi:hypothetical protein
MGRRLWGKFAALVDASKAQLLTRSVLQADGTPADVEAGTSQRSRDVVLNVGISYGHAR